MAWNILGIIGTVGFFVIGLLILFAGFWKAQERGEKWLPWYQRAQVLGGIGIVLFACFVGLFDISLLSTNNAIKIGTILIGFLFFVAGFLFMIVSLLIYRMRKDRK